MTKISKQYIKSIKDKYDFPGISALFKNLEEKKVLVIGDTIIDEYVFILPKGRAIKDPILSVEYQHHETYAGGILAIANHVSTFVNEVKLVTLLGDHRTKKEFIEGSLLKNVELKAFEKKDSPTVIKKRYVDQYKDNKLFKIEFINDKPIAKDLTKDIVEYLKTEIPKYDIVLVGDFGHGFINDDIRSVLQKDSKYLAINAQSNSANMGYNYINHYRKSDYMSLDEQELRLPLMRRFEPLNEVIDEFREHFQYTRFLVTKGKDGSVLVNNGNQISAPVLITTVVDTVGAGDALFAISSLAVYSGAEDELVPFIANCAGGIKANYMGNKESVTKKKLLDFIKEVLS